MFKSLFKLFRATPKPKAVRFGELSVTFELIDSSDRIAQYSIIFFEYEDGEREYTVKGSHTMWFDRTLYFAQCETWKYTGLFPDWSKDPLAEKLSR